MTYRKLVTQGNQMKITRKEIRKLVKEEAKRELPISYYSDEMLVQEGLMDFLGNLFGSFVKMFTGAFDEAEKKVGTRWNDATSKVQGIASKLLGKEEAADIKSFDDLDLEKKEHKKVYFSALVDLSANTIEEYIPLLQAAAGIEDWTPADDSEEAAKEWQKENGETSLGLFTAAGGVGGNVKFFGEKGIKSAAAAYADYQEKVKDGNPAGAAQSLINNAKVLSDIWNFAEQVDVKGADKISAGWEKLERDARLVGEAIERSGKEQQKESLELRKLINHMIIAERKIIKENK